MRRSYCPIANALDYVGDKWSLLILRDLMFFNKSAYSELQLSEERIATNILSNRLEKLENDGLITKQPDPDDKRKKHYQLTSKGKDLLPVILEMMVWSSKYDPESNVSKSLIKRIKNERQRVIDDVLDKLQAQ